MMILRNPSHTIVASGNYATIAYIDSTETFNTRVGNKPTNATNDICLLQMIEYDQSTGVFTAPSGFTKITGSNALITSPNVVHQELAYKILDGSEGATFTWSSTTGGYSETLLATYRNIDLTTPIDVNAQINTGDGTAVTTTSIVPTTPKDMFILFHGGYFNGISANPSGMTQREINDTVNYIFDELRSTSSAITKSYTRAGGASDAWVNAVVLLRPATI